MPVPVPVAVLRGRGEAVVAVPAPPALRLGRAVADQRRERRRSQQWPGDAVRRGARRERDQRSGHQHHLTGTQPAAALHTLGHVRITLRQGDLYPAHGQIPPDQPCDLEEFRVRLRVRRPCHQQHRGAGVPVADVPVAYGPQDRRPDPPDQVRDRAERRGEQQVARPVAPRPGQRLRGRRPENGVPAQRHRHHHGARTVSQGGPESPSGVVDPPGAGQGNAAPRDVRGKALMPADHQHGAAPRPGHAVRRSLDRVGTAARKTQVTRTNGQVSA